jgi:hypothetical protein
VPIFLAEALLASVSRHQQNESTGVCGILPIPAQLSSTDGVEQAEMILYAALDPAIANRARQGDFVKCLDHFNLLQN